MNEAVYGALLFFLMTPGILFRYPFDNVYLVTASHAIVFALLFYMAKQYMHATKDHFSDVINGSLAVICFLLLISCLLSGRDCMLGVILLAFLPR
jgi:positive regulator of sigma E activity